MGADEDVFKQVTRKDALQSQSLLSVYISFAFRRKADP